MTEPGSDMPILSGTAIRRLIDRVAGWVICAAGLAVIIALLSMLVLVGIQALPLFLPAESMPMGRFSIAIDGDDIAAMAVDSDLHHERMAVFVIDRHGRVGFAETGGFGIGPATLAGKAERKLVRVEPHGGNRFSLLWDDGCLTLLEVRFDWSGGEGHAAAILAEDPGKDGNETSAFGMIRGGVDNYAAVRVYVSGKITETRLKPGKSLIGNKKPALSTREVAFNPKLGIVSSILAADATQLYLGTGGGELVSVPLPDSGDLAVNVVPAFHDRRSMTSLSFLVGGFAFAAGDSRGGVSIWFPRRENDAWQLRRSQYWDQRFVGTVEAIHASSRNRVFLVKAGSEGALFHSTDGKESLSFDPASGISLMALNARGDCMATLYRSGDVEFRRIDNPYPEAGWKAFFGRLLYEGYNSPAFIWQSTGGEGNEPKLSLTPLVWGTLKGSLYAMIFAVPLALAAAVYVSQLADPMWRGKIKPAVEMLAAVPSVVIGFFAALWLAPMLERHLLVPPLFLAVLLTVCLPLFFIRRWFNASRGLMLVESRHAFLAALPFAILVLAVSILLEHPIERMCFGGGFQAWLADNAPFRYDQRNALVIAIAMGFAVIPTIFSLAEDALSAVPPSLSAASLALGATKWQTVARVIVPSASPGIFTAVMLGFGRAVGETMIVLMATGNTPLLSLSPFNGMRTLSANIAVEMPEAPVGGTLFRTLFLCALVLFALTFAVNTVAELVRGRLRRRYGSY